MRLLSFLLGALLFTSAGQAAAAGSELRIAAASDLRFALAEMADRYRKDSPRTEVKLTFGSSGKFRTQIESGAPFDLYLSADTENPAALAAAGKGEGEVFAYALGHLVLWVRNDSPLQLDAKLRCLQNESAGKIALANPRHAPYGRIAEAALKKAGLRGKLEGRLVFGDDISRAAQFVESGAAGAGIIAGSLAASSALKAKGRSVPVDSSLYEPLRQSGIVLKGPGAEEAAKFARFFRSEPAKAIMRRYGLDPR